jgi:serine protease Do
MQNRTLGLAALLAVIGISIVFGMILGGRLNAPPVMLAAPLQLAPQITASVGVAGGSDFADIVERSMPAVVSVTSTARGSDPHAEVEHPMMDDPFFRRFFFNEQEDGEGRPQTPRRRIGAGSGFIISPDGYVMTNNHVIEDFERVEVTMSDGKSYEAQVVGADPSIDLALLKIDTDGREMPTLPLGDSKTLRVGEWVLAIGNPHDFDQTVTVGIVSGKERRVPLAGLDGGVVSFIQTDAAINLGNSGGPLLDARGNVIGINTAIRRQNFAEGIGFALPIDTARAAVDQLRESGEVRRGWIGITMNDTGIDETVREYYGLPDVHGVLVKAVTDGGPAAEAGMEVGDVIRAVDGDDVRDNMDMIGKISSRRPGERVDLSVYRAGRVVDLRVTLGDRERGIRAGTAGDEQAPAPSSHEERIEESTGLGLTVENIGDRARQRLGMGPHQQGVLITEVDFKSEADAKGLQPTMIIVAVNDRPVRSVADWEAALEQLESGSPVKLDISPPGSDQVYYFFLRAPK